jgi:tripartite-type tricarboxylate transporter receptor subunit TctC
MSSQRLAAFPDVPTLVEANGPDWQMSAWRGIAGPAGLPDDVATKLSAAMEKVYNSAEFIDAMNGRGFGLNYLPSAKFSEWMQQSDAAMGIVMNAVGLAK